MWTKNTIIGLGFLLSLSFAFGQSLSVTNRLNLDDKLEEISGLLILNNTGYGINDSGGEPCLYSFSLDNGAISNRMCLKNVRNNDFEAICDNEDYIFIGDIGNNLANRSSFQIYRIDKDDVFSGNQSLDYKKIEFTLPNYSPFFSRSHNFDMEAMHTNFVGDSLYIYSKNRADSNVNVYGVAIDFSDRLQVAKKLGTFKINELITAATIYKNDLYLLAYNRINSVVYRIENYDAVDIELWQANEIQVPGIGFQRESLFIEDDNFYIASEKTKIQKQNLFTFQLK